MESILLVEPYRQLNSLVAVALEEEGYRVAIVESRTEAVEALRSSHFDLIITEAFDQSFQGEFDPAFLDEFRLIGGNIPIILLSTYVASPGVRARDYGLAEVIPKPFDIDELLEKVNRVLDRNRG